MPSDGSPFASFGFRALHIKAGPASDRKETLHLPPSVLEEGNLLANRNVRIENIM